MQPLTDTNGGFLVSPYAIRSTGVPSISWGRYQSNAIVNQSYAGGIGWQTSHTLAGLPTEAMSVNTILVTAGAWVAAAWTKSDLHADTSSLWIQITGLPGTDVPAGQVSSDLLVAATSARVVATADGGVTAIWIEEYQPNGVTGRLVSRCYGPR